MLRLFFTVLLVLATVPLSWAATIPAASCNNASGNTAVQAAVNLAVNGDTVTIPAGDCTWDTSLTINKNIFLQGPGESLLTIRDNVTKPTPMIQVTPNGDFGITGFTMIGQALDPSGSNFGHISIRGTSSNMHIHHITVKNQQSTFIRAGGCLYGVIHHITGGSLTGSLAPMANFEHDTCFGSTAYGDGSWANPLQRGSANAVYLENNTWFSQIIDALGNHFMDNFADGYMGLRMVVRYNNFTNANTTMHGTDSGGRARSSRWRETYGNTYTVQPAWAADFLEWFRGGSGVMFNNTISLGGGVNNIAKHIICRDPATSNCGLGTLSNPFGSCTGTNPYDQNSIGGYMCVDQPGAGTSNDLLSAAVPPATWIHNTREPIYVYNNTANGSPDNCATFGCNNENFVNADRDIFFGKTSFNGTSGVGVGTLAARPATCTQYTAYWATDQGGNWDTTNATANDGQLYQCNPANTWTLIYTPFTYPHPLQTGTGSSSDTTPPSDVTGLTATATSSSSIALTWNAATDNVGIGVYNVERCTPGGCSNYATIIQINATTYTDTGLNANTTYQYRVKAQDTSGNVSVNYSNVATATTPAPSITPQWSPRIQLRGAQSEHLQFVRFGMEGR